MLDDSPLLGPNRIAEKCREGLVAIEAEIAAAKSEREAKALRKRQHARRLACDAGDASQCQP